MVRLEADHSRQKTRPELGWTKVSENISPYALTVTEELTKGPQKGLLVLGQMAAEEHGTIIHELAHPYAKKYPSLVDTFVEKKGWGTFATTSQSWDKVSADASPYSLTRLNSAFAAEEDFADHVARMLAPLEPLHPRYGGSSAAWYYQSSPVDSWIETIPQTR